MCFGRFLLVTAKAADLPLVFLEDLFFYHCANDLAVDTSGIVNILLPDERLETAELDICHQGFGLPVGTSATFEGFFQLLRL